MPGPYPDIKSLNKDIPDVVWSYNTWKPSYDKMLKDIEGSANLTRKHFDCYTEKLPTLDRCADVNIDLIYHTDTRKPSIIVIARVGPRRGGSGCPRESRFSDPRDKTFFKYKFDEKATINSHVVSVEKSRDGDYTIKIIKNPGKTDTHTTGVCLFSAAAVQRPASLLEMHLDGVYAALYK